MSYSVLPSLLVTILMLALADQLPRLGKRELFSSAIVYS